MYFTLAIVYNLQQKLDDAKGKLDNKEDTKTAKKKVVPGKPGKGKKKGKVEEDKTEEELEREAIRTKHEEEKQVQSKSSHTSIVVDSLGLQEFNFFLYCFNKFSQHF